VKWLQEQLVLVATEYKFTQGYTCLAAGADQLFAGVLQGLGIPFVVVVPSKNYESTFQDPGVLTQYRSLLSSAYRVMSLEFYEPSESAFWEAGRKVVDSSDVVVAVWNGKPAKGLGGTGDVVKYAQCHGKPVVHLNPITLTVVKI